MFYSCGSDDNSRQKVSDEQRIIGKEESQRIVLMTGDRDEFHSESSFESIRKKKLTDMGMLNIPPPVITPDIQAVEKAIDNPEFFNINVRIFNSKELKIPSYPFDYENDISALNRLYKSHNLDNIVNNRMKKLQKLQALMIYTYNFFAGGTEPNPETDIGPSAEVITKLRREKNVGGTSKHYTALLCQLALSCGFNARIISMHSFDENEKVLTHDVCEIYLNDFDKWAVFDAYNRATCYFRDNIPQSALELREVMLNQNYRVLDVFSGIGDFTNIISVREKMLPRYKYLYMWRMNDILSKSPKGGSIPWQALYQTHLVWEDEMAPVAEGGFDKFDKFNSNENIDYPLNGVRFVTHDRGDFNWPLNHVSINVERTGQEDIILYFDTITPNFDSFEIVDFGIKRQREYTYKLGKSITFRIRSVNKFGMLGPASRLSFSL